MQNKLLNQKWQHGAKNMTIHTNKFRRRGMLSLFIGQLLCRNTIFAQLGAVVEHPSITILRSATHCPTRSASSLFLRQGRLGQEETAKCALTIDRYPSLPPGLCLNSKLSSLADVPKQMF